MGLNKLLLLVVISYVVLVKVNAQSPTSSSPNNNITIGSTISTSSTNQTSYWISSSTNFAFGFYPLSTSNGSNNDEHLIGIWLTTTCTKTLVWSLGRNDPSLYGSGSPISFDQDGVLMLQVEDNAAGSKSKTPLLGNMVTSPASYASIQNDGNFVIYNSDSQIIWQSFDYVEKWDVQQ
ncbi:hypothetical protein FRX31_034564 [Thalictrum thalictroides]|uniref:Bulb-type lectin domain-containing protein n=1 Tax=Thalictrum thalictroides TaxID=46969 RepID=A0A7J6UTE5_THATH|nr:hypothetical protein FRX31_034564 [Thalictrum thalictroides]